MHFLNPLSIVAALAVCLLAPGRSPAQPGAQPVTMIQIDATKPVPEVHPVKATMGTSRSPSGSTLLANSQFLTRDGKPWIPVMGELHYSRLPERDWESAILKMKAAGVDIISAYIIWIHHEQHEGSFDWKGRKDLRHFAELCGKHGVLLYPRIGPWAHAEVRNGGIPDWVLKRGPVRENDPLYLAEVGRLYAEIGQQLHGLYWKDGGPIVGIQLENEYRSRGPGKGDDHIRTLKAMAIKQGMDVPFYTVTGWDGAAIPLDAALPVFGGYADAPWSDSPAKLPPAEVYAFRLLNRAGGAMGIVGGGGQSSADVYRGTPFLTAEVGGGIQDTYFRRPVVTPDDIAAMASVMVGSGANLLGYYMFHGGRNPEGGDITLQESQATGYPTDLPVKSYDFQAPLSPDGEERPSLRRLKLLNYFLNDFGGLLAPMSPRGAAVQPTGPDDLDTPRVVARTEGDRGFLFFNNYVRGTQMPARRNVSIELALPKRTLHIPDAPIDLPDGAYGIWPVNLDLNGTILRYSTAQLFKRAGTAAKPYYFFFGLPGIRSEFAFEGDVQARSSGGKIKFKLADSGLTIITPDPKTTSDFTLVANGRETHIVLLTLEAAEDLWKLDDPATLLSSPDQFFSDGPVVHLLAEGKTRFNFGTFGFAPQPAPGLTHTSTATPDLFQNYIAGVPPAVIKITATQTRQPGPRSPLQNSVKQSWQQNTTVQAPPDSEFGHAAEWSLTLQAPAPGGHLHSVLLRVRYRGDEARLLDDNLLLDDDFYNGLPWVTAPPAKEGGQTHALHLQILPFPRTFPMYLEPRARLAASSPDGNAHLDSVQAIPIYELSFTIKQP